MVIGSHWLVWWRCFKHQWRDITVAALSFVGYFGTGHIPGLKAHRVPTTALDRAVPLLPWTVYGYVSLYPLLIANLIYLVPRPGMLRPLLQAITLANGFSGIIFVAYRTTVPRPSLPGTQGAWLLRRLWQADPPYNAVPSLHTTYSVLIALAHWRWRLPQRLVVLPWCGIIILTTLTTKQHYIIDLLGGAALALSIGLVVLDNPIPSGSRLAPSDG